MHDCIWCSRQFSPRTVGANYYSLLSAGSEICWNCADLYEVAEVEMYLGCLKARVEGLTSLLTENGSQLPFIIESWTRPRTPWGKPKGRAKDTYGRFWSIKPNGGYAKLKPIAGMGRMVRGSSPTFTRFALSIRFKGINHEYSQFNSVRDQGPQQESRRDPGRSLLVGKG